VRKKQLLSKIKQLAIAHSESLGDRNQLLQGFKKLIKFPFKTRIELARFVKVNLELFVVNRNSISMAEKMSKSTQTIQEQKLS
jgi:hypothetical protein